MKRTVFVIALLVLVGVFVGAGYKLFSTMWGYKEAVDYYNDISGAYVQANPGRTGPSSANESQAQTQTDAQTQPQTQAEAQGQTQAQPQVASQGADGSAPKITPVPAAYPAPAAPGQGPQVEANALMGPPVPDPNVFYRTTTDQPPVSVNFDALLQANPDVVGWLYCKDTEINYPVVQANDNDYYLRRKLDGSESASGSIFMEATCNRGETLDDNTIIYGHNMKNGSMFHCLSQYNSQTFFEAHPTMWFLTPERDYKIELFSGFVTKPGDEVFQIQFSTLEGKQKFLQTALSKSTFRTGLQPRTEDRFITLSTCDYTFNDARYVVVGALVPVVYE